MPYLAVKPRPRTIGYVLCPGCGGEWVVKKIIDVDTHYYSMEWLTRCACNVDEGQVYDLAERTAF